MKPDTKIEVIKHKSVTLYKRPGKREAIDLLEDLNRSAKEGYYVTSMRPREITLSKREVWTTQELVDELIDSVEK